MVFRLMQIMYLMCVLYPIHWDFKLPPITDLNYRPITAFLNRYTKVHNFIYQTCSYIELWLPILESNNCSYLTIAIRFTTLNIIQFILPNNLANYFFSKGKKCSIVLSVSEKGIS